MPRFAVLAALVFMVVSCALKVMAQEDRPLINPAERKTPRKKDVGPRAVGIVQLSTNGKASIVPIAILINGKFWDASAYKADPVPMALESGTVYEGERSGSSLGLFTVGSALHSNNPNASVPWLGTGVWHPNGTEAPEKPAKAEAAPVGIEVADAPPRLTRDTNAAKSSSTSAPSSSTPPSGASSSAPKPTSGSGDEPPRLTKGNPPPQSSASEPAASASASGQAKPDEGKTSENKQGEKARNQPKGNRESVPASDSGASEANRPKLRRGKPAESFADEVIPGYSLPGIRRAHAENAGKVVETLAANKADIQLIPAISDAEGPIPHSFAFEWIPGEEADRRKQMVDLAKDQLRAYVAAKSKKVETATERKLPAKQMVAPKPADPVLENMQMVAYDLWNSNQPVLILSAQAHMPPAGGTAAQPESDLQYSIVLVAYPDIYHNLHKLYIAITDKYHLDMTPRLELVDAVDADGDGYGELLFRETSDLGTGWVIYRATADKLWKMFDSLNPE